MVFYLVVGFVADRFLCFKKQAGYKMAIMVITNSLF